MTDLGAELQALHDDHEINAAVDSFWDGQWRVRIGDPVNGYRQEWRCGSAAEAAELLRTYRDNLDVITGTRGALPPRGVLALDPRTGAPVDRPWR